MLWGTAYHAVADLSSVQFSEGETELLSIGLRYNLTYNNTTRWLENFIIEKEVAVSKLFQILIETKYRKDY